MCRISYIYCEIRKQYIIPRRNWSDDEALKYFARRVIKSHV